MNHSYGVETFATAHTLYSIFVRLHLYVWVRMALIAICEHEKLCVGEVKGNNSMHVIHLNNQPMQWIMTHCKHLDTLGKKLKKMFVLLQAQIPNSLCEGRQMKTLNSS